MLKEKELAGKTLGIIGFGRIGQEVAKRAIGLGMNVIAHDKFVETRNIELNFFDGQKNGFLDHAYKLGGGAKEILISSLYTFLKLATRL